MQNRPYKKLALSQKNIQPHATLKICHSASIKAVTLIEMIVVIVVLGVAIPPLLNMWADVSWRSVRSETLADASFYAQGLMEEIKSKRYDEKTAAPWTNSAGFGAASDGENAGNKTTFDDVDDFIGCTDPEVTTPASGYNRSVSVVYTILNANTWTDGGVTSCQAVNNCTALEECCYKHIKVSVSRANAAQEVSLDTIISSH